LNTENSISADFEFISEIRNFVAFGAKVDGQATTKEILEQFRSKIPRTETVNFKAMLKQICNFDKVTGTGIWSLRSEFR